MMDKNTNFKKISEKKECLCHSLKEVNYFLNNINKAFFIGKVIKKIKK